MRTHPHTGASSSSQSCGATCPHLVPCVRRRFREIFNLVDLDKGGTISKDELKQLMNTLGLKPSQVRAPRRAWSSPSEALMARPPCASPPQTGGAQPDGG